MPKYEIRHPVKINGEIHRDGSIGLERDTAQPLVDSGSLIAVTTPAKSEAKTDTPAPAKK